jgi:hypothetical protein
MQSQKLVLALGLLLAGTAIASAQDMRPPINADDVKWGPVPPTLLRARNSLSFLATLPKRAYTFFG